MLRKLFGMNDNFDADSHTSAAEDAKAIQESVDYIMIQAAWTEYEAIKASDDAYDSDTVAKTHAWTALSKVIEQKGNFSFFPLEDLPLLKALHNGYLVYSDLLHVLIDHHDDEKAADHLFAAHPELHDALPDEFDDNSHVIEVLIEVIKDYQWQLEHFSDKHKDAIESAITVLENKHAT